jgi:hypothetical protein
MIPDLKLYFILENGLWFYRLKNLLDEVIYETPSVKLLPEMNNSQYFDGWENQVRNFTVHNIVEVHRFI